jgi:predicted dehydrogenase
MAKVRIGFIGAGWWATTNHIPLLAQHPNVEMVGVCRLGKEMLQRIQDEFNIPFGTEEYAELLAQGLDGVVVTSPHHLHYEHARAALLAGCHVMVEKPMTLKAADAWALVELAHARNLQIIVPYGWHYTPYIQQAKQLMDDGIVGQIEHVMCHMASPTKALFGGSGAPPAEHAADFLAPDPKTWQVKEHGGGYAHGQITHASGLMFWLTGLRAEEVSARIATVGAPVDMYNAATLRFANGALGVVSGAATLPDHVKFQLDIRIFGSEGLLLLDIERARMQVFRHDGKQIALDLPADAGAYSCDGPPARFVELIQGHGRNDSPGEVAARSVELIDAMFRSANDGGRPVQVQ